MYKMHQTLVLEEPLRDDFLTRMEVFIDWFKERYGHKPKRLLVTQSLRKLFGNAEVTQLFDIPVEYFKSTSYPPDRIIVYMLHTNEEGRGFVESAVFTFPHEKADKGGSQDAQSNNQN